REVKDYIYEDALRQLLESEKIKSVIRDFEQDMWNN
ncbi:MAG: gliding motility protein GldN, partial [Bacteroidetes bacterium]|nr:gliding motility protein GldN [Bacteroidota bacterium]